ncbi:MAG: dihydroorotate dehydrogenase electron transfer subunit [Candidatus Omnitrophota bacterium]
MNTKAKDEVCTVIENSKIKKNYFLMKLESDYISSQFDPGNFVMVAASTTWDPLLKRPFGILRAEPPYFWLYYDVVGRGTALISSLKPNDRVKVLGPLGNSFPSFENKNMLMVAGGRGIAPIFGAISRYASANRVFLIYGARHRDDLNLLEDIERLPLIRRFLYTDDGSAGQKGLVTSDIGGIIAENAIDVTVSCGPEAMFESLSHTLKGLNTENYVSMEALMGCGFGICYSCAVKAVDGSYRKVCSDGPIFRMEELAW